MKRALVITIVLGVLMLAVALWAKPSFRVSQIVESDGRRQLDYTFMNLNVTSRIEATPGLKIKEPTVRRIKEALVLPPEFLESPAYVIRTTGEKQVNWYFHGRVKGTAKRIADYLKAKNGSLQLTASKASPLITLNGTGADGSNVWVTIGNFGGSSGPAVATDIGINVLDPRR
jgi:hypothetical protein